MGLHVDPTTPSKFPGNIQHSSTNVQFCDGHGACYQQSEFVLQNTAGTTNLNAHDKQVAMTLNNLQQTDTK